MKPLVRRILPIVALLTAAMSIVHADDPKAGAQTASQAAADVLKDYAASDGAFLAAGLVKADGFQKDNLASLLEYPTDHLVVIELTGSQIRQAFERSVSLFPQPNVSFLQISGFEVTFNKNAAPNSRVTSVTTNGASLVDGHTYTVAMPSSLQRGGLGYFKIWDKAKVVRTYESKTLDDLLKGKAVVASSPRWLPQG